MLMQSPLFDASHPMLRYFQLKR